MTLLMVPNISSSKRNNAELLSYRYRSKEGMTGVLSVVQWSKQRTIKNQRLADSCIPLENLTHGAANAIHPMITTNRNLLEALFRQ